MSALGVSLGTNGPTRHFNAHSQTLTFDRCLHTINLTSGITDNVLTESSKLLCRTRSVTIAEMVQTVNAFVFRNRVVSSYHLTIIWCSTLAFLFLVQHFYMHSFEIKIRRNPSSNVASYFYNLLDYDTCAL